MSWQGYVDNNLVGTGHVSQGAIVGQEGGVWAASAGFQVKPQEITALAAAFKDPSGIRQKGFDIAGVHYIAIRADDRSIYGKRTGGGVCAVKTGKAILIGVYGDKIQPGQCATTVEKLADYLIEQGY
jgi:profilin